MSYPRHKWEGIKIFTLYRAAVRIFTHPGDIATHQYIYIYMCVCVCVRVRVRPCVRVCERERERVKERKSMYVWVYVCLRKGELERQRNRFRCYVPFWYAPVFIVVVTFNWILCFHLDLPHDIYFVFSLSILKQLFCSPLTGSLHP